MGAEGPSLLGISRHPAGGVVGSRPDRRVTFLRGHLPLPASPSGGGQGGGRRGPLPAPWTPGAVVPDLRPLCAFRLEPSSGLSAAWVDTRRPPPLGCCVTEGVRFEGLPLLGFPGIPAGWLPLEEGLSLLSIFRHPAGGVVGSRPDRGYLSCAGISPSLPPPLGEGREGAAGGLCRPPGPQALSFQTCSRSVPST